jgi:hypothetical protein
MDDRDVATLLSDIRAIRDVLEKVLEELKNFKCYCGCTPDTTPSMPSPRDYYYVYSAPTQPVYNAT